VGLSVATKSVVLNVECQDDLERSSKLKEMGITRGMKAFPLKDSCTFVKTELKNKQHMESTDLKGMI
jgi:hypothetical protein